MGQTLLKLSEKKLSDKSIFNNRFVVECCELFHIHYRNLRIVLNSHDFEELANGFTQALKRWGDRGSPEPRNGTHIELTRKRVADVTVADDSILINLNKNLYELNQGKIFAEGADLKDPKYIHLKIRDLRVELTLDEFTLLTEAIKEADEKLCALR